MPDSPSLRLAPGDTVGPYQVLSLIGVGGMGEVYRARDTRLNREVAVKVLAAGSADADRLRRFEQEAKVIAALNHPNIVAVFDLGALQDGTPFVVSELLEGQSLAERMLSGPIPPRKIVEWAIQIAQGLAAAHERGAVHRDLKPDNLFVLRDGRIKILDFGLAKLLSDTDSAGGTMTTITLTEPGIVMGTVGYMSPEQVRGLPVDHRTDIFSFGAVLYEMFTSQRAFREETATETMTAILKQDPRPLIEFAPQIPLSLDRVVIRCLEKDPAERFQSARDVAFALDALGASGAASAPVEALMARHSSVRWLWVGLGATALVAILAMGALALRSANSPTPRTFTRLTFERGFVERARFAPDGQTVIASGLWEGQPKDTLAFHIGNPVGSSLGLEPGTIQSIAPDGEMAIIFQDGMLARTPPGSGARAVATDISAADWTPDGKNLAVAHYVGGKVRVEMPVGTTLYETPNWIDELRVSPKGDQIAVIEHPQQVDMGGGGSAGAVGSLVTIDRAHRVHVQVKDWREIVGMAWAPDGQSVWFTGENAGVSMGLYSVTLSGRLRPWMHEMGGMEMFDVDRSGRLLLGRSDATGDSTLGRLAEESEEHNLTLLNGSVIADLSDDGRAILFTELAGVYFRKSQESESVRLADGTALALSPDETTALVTPDGHTLNVVPTGPGETKTLERGAIETYARAAYFPDGKRILIVGREKGHPDRGWIQSLANGPPQPVTPEGVFVAERSITPNGRAVVGIGRDGLALYPFDGSAPQRIPGLNAGGLPLQWTADGRYLYVRVSELPARVVRLDPATGQREIWKDLAPADRTGVRLIGDIRLTPDGTSYAYSYDTRLMTLYLVDGIG